MKTRTVEFRGYVIEVRVHDEPTDPIYQGLFAPLWNPGTFRAEASTADRFTVGSIVTAEFMRDAMDPFGAIAASAVDGCWGARS